MAESILEVVIRARNEAKRVLHEINQELHGARESVDDLNRSATDELRGDVEQTEKATKDLNTSLEKTSGTKFEELKREFNVLRDGMHRIKDAAHSAQQALNAVSQKGKDIIKGQIVKSLFAGGTVASAAGFSKALGEVRTLIDDTSVSTNDLAKEVTELSGEFGQDKTVVTKAYYDALSAGAAKGAEASNLLRVALKTAIGGATDAGTAVDGLTTVINAFGKDFSEAEQVADVMFTTMKGGKTTIGELSNFMFQVAPLASALGVSFEEVSGAITALTLQGTKTPQALTGIRAALQGMIRPGAEAEEAFQNAGFASAKLALEAVGLQGAFDIMAEAAGGSEGALLKMVGSIEGVQAILQTTGDKSSFLTDALKNIENSSGALTVAYEKMAEELGFQTDRLRKNTDNAFSAIGFAIGSAVQPIIELIADLAGALNDLIRENPRVAKFFGGLFAFFIGLKIALGLVLIAGAALVGLFTKFLAFRALGVFVSLFTGKLEALAIILSSLKGAIIKVFGPATFVLLRSVLVGLSVAVLKATAAILGFFKLTSLSLVFKGLAASMGVATKATIGLGATYVSVMAKMSAATAGLRKAILATYAALALNPIGRVVTALAAAGIAIYNVVGAYNDWQRAEEKLTDLQQKQRAQAKALEEAGTRRVEIQATEKLMELRQEEFDQYREGLIGNAKLIGNERQELLLLTNRTEEQTARLKELNAEELANVAAVRAASAEAERRAEAMAASGDAAEEAKLSADRYAASLQAVSQINLDEAVRELDTVHEANVRALSLRGDEQGLLAEHLNFARRRVDLERNAARDRLQVINETERRRIEEARAAEEDITSIQEEAADARVESARQEMQRIVSIRQSVASQMESTIRRIASLDQRIADVRLQGEFDVADLNRGRLSEAQQVARAEREIAQLTSRIKEAIAKEDFEVAEALANRQKGLAREVNREVKDGEKVIISKEAAAQKAIRATQLANNNLISVLEARKAKEQDTLKSQQEVLTNLDRTIDKLNKTLLELAGKDIEIKPTLDTAEFKKTGDKVIDDVMGRIQAQALAKKIGVPITADTRQYEAEFQSKVLADDGNVVKVGVFLDDGVYKTKVQELQGEEIVATGRVEFAGADLEAAIAHAKGIIERANSGDFPALQLATTNAAIYRQFEALPNELQALVAGNSVVVSAEIQTETEEFTRVLQKINSTIAQPKARFDPQTTAVDAARVRVAQPITVPVRFDSQGGTPQLNQGGAVQAFAKGGMPRFAQGMVRGPGTTKSDSILARLSRGEFVMRAEAVKKYGPGLLSAMNKSTIDTRRLPAFATGGMVGGSSAAGQGPSEVVALDLSVSGRPAGRLTGSRDSVGQVVRALKDLQRGL
jgi:TP901 family phage tail tape measure protein